MDRNYIYDDLNSKNIYICRICVCVCVQFSVAGIQIGGKLQVIIGIWDCTHY